MDEKLLNQKDLANRWQVSVQAIENYRKDGLITPCKNVPGIKYSSQYIRELEGVKIEKFSPLERRRLEAELEKANKQNTELKNILSKVLAESSKVIGF